MKFGLNGLRSWDRSIWIIPGRESIDASKKIFLFNLVVPWWNDERIFLLRIHAKEKENHCCSRGEGEKKNGVYIDECNFDGIHLVWIARFYITRIIQRTSCIITWIWDSTGLYITGRGRVSAIFTIPWRESPPINYRQRDQSFRSKEIRVREIVEEIVARIRLQFVFERRKQRSLQ